MSKANTKAASLRTMMVVLIVIIIGLSAFGFYLAQDQLNTLAISTGQTIAKSTDGSISSQGIANLKEEMVKKQVVISKASNITVPSQDYQSQIIADLTKYATNNGLLITDYNVSNSTITGLKASTTNGVKSNYITITLGNPVPMIGLIKFLKSIESNLPKMQLTGITLKDNPALSGTVNIDPLTIEVFTK
jgi:hypothetical protein